MLTKLRVLMLLSVLLCLLTVPMLAHAVTNTWTGGAANNNWFDDGNWSEPSAPADGQDVVIDSSGALTNVVLSNFTANLASFTISNATLMFSNWNTTLNATNVVIRNNGILTLPAAFTNGGMSNRVSISCSNNFTIEVGGRINADQKGYAFQNGPGVGKAEGEGGAGGGYGGKGGIPYYGSASELLGGVPYGFTNAPVDPGSGGGGPGGGGGDGGGAVCIDAGGTVTIHGTITANGGNGTTTRMAGGGSGGGIYITCGTFGGSTNGVLQANGGNGSSIHGPVYGGGGGGGRIAVVYTNSGSPHAVRFSTSHGTGWSNYQGAPDYSEGVDNPGYQYNPTQYGADIGTVYLSNTNLLSETLTDRLFTNVRLYISGLTAWGVSSLTVSNCSVTFAEDGFQLIVINDLRIGTNGSLGIGANSGNYTSVLACGGNLILTNGGSLSVYSGITNATTTNYGALVSVTNDMLISASSWVYPFSHETNGGSVLFRMRDLVIDGGTNGGFNANDKGYMAEQGTGRGVPSSSGGGGGGYGGQGGLGYYIGALGGRPYGFTNAPVDPGSGGANGYSRIGSGGSGGGAVHIDARGTVTIHGTITANGGKGCISNVDRKGGGSGGGIYITCQTFGGSTNGVLQANGSNAGLPYGGGGGGGRIAVWYGVPENIRALILAGQTPKYVVITNMCAGFLGTVSVTNGTGWTNPPSLDGAFPGTSIFLRYVPAGTVFKVY